MRLTFLIDPTGGAGERIDVLTKREETRHEARPGCSKLLFLAALAFAVSAGAMAQTELKWAHVYETSEPFHTESVWAAQEIEKRTNGRYHIDVYPASQLGRKTTSTRA